MIPLHRKLNCLAPLKSPEKFDHSFFSNYTGHWYAKHIMEQTFDFNPSKNGKNGSAIFCCWPPFISLKVVILAFYHTLLEKRQRQGGNLGFLSCIFKENDISC